MLMKETMQIVKRIILKRIIIDLRTIQYKLISYFNRQNNKEEQIISKKVRIRRLVVGIEITLRKGGLIRGIGN